MLVDLDLPEHVPDHIKDEIRKMRQSLARPDGYVQIIRVWNQCLFVYRICNPTHYVPGRARGYGIELPDAHYHFPAPGVCARSCLEPMQTKPITLDRISIEMGSYIAELSLERTRVGGLDRRLPVCDHNMEATLQRATYQLGCNLTKTKQKMDKCLTSCLARVNQVSIWRDHKCPCDLINLSQVAPARHSPVSSGANKVDEDVLESVVKKVSLVGRFIASAIGWR